MASSKTSRLTTMMHHSICPQYQIWECDEVTKKPCFVKRLTEHCCILLNPPKLQNSYKYNVAVYLYYVHGAWNLSWHIFKAQEGEENNAETSFNQTDPEKESLSCAPPPHTRAPQELTTSQAVILRGS